MSMLRGFATVAMALSIPALAACEKDQFKGAEAEVGKEKINPDMPAVPKFDLPPPNAEGPTVKELRVKGRKYFEQEVTVKGYVTWIYDCATAIAQPGQSPEDVKKIIDEDPTRCSKPKFRLGDAPDSAEEQTLKVVEVPRYPTALEKKNLDKKEIEDPTIWRPVPPLKVGDQVIVVGDWKQRAPHGDSDMDGLLVYKTLTNASMTPPWSTDAALAALATKKHK
jgi:hypothetical protein